MMDFDWRSAVKTVAPILGGAVAPPFGAIAGKFLADALGCDNNEKAVAEAMGKATPEQLLAIKGAEQTFKVKMEELGVDLLKIDADDRKDARKAMTDNKSFDKLFMLGLAVTIIALVAECYAGFAVLPTGVDKTLTGRVLGTLDALAMTFWTFNYGSSAGSKAKDEMIYNSTPIK